MNTPKQRQTFLSYSRTDKEFALELARALKSAGYFVWLDQLDIPAGARWDDAVERALYESEIFLIILTPASISSDNVKDEIGYAIDHGKRILPVLLKECTVPLRLRRFQYVDFTKMKFSEGIKRAEDLLQNLINERSTPVPAPFIAEAQEIPKTERTTVSHLPVQKTAQPRRWISSVAGILAVILCLVALGTIILFREFIIRLANGPQSQTTPLVTQTKKVTSTLTHRPPTRTPLPILTPTPVQMTGEIVVNEQGHISPGFGNQWEFSPPSSLILIRVDFRQPTNSCPIEVWVVDTNANQIIFTEIITPGLSNYTASVTLEPNGNYTVVVGGNDRSSSVAGCSGTEEFFFEITVWS